MLRASHYLINTSFNLLIPISFILINTLTCQANPLKGTNPLLWEGDIASKLVDTADAFLLEKIENLKYILYCHDYKFVGHMQPQQYENFIVPKEKLVCVSLFKNASAVICQSSLQ